MVPTSHYLISVVYCTILSRLKRRVVRTHVLDGTIISLM